MDDYINFIAALAQETNIMEKSFYVVVPYYSAGNLTSTVGSSKNLLTNLFAPQKQLHVRIDEAAYNKARDELANRVNAVISGLFQTGVSAKQLDTKELGELYYNCYNPDTAVREPLVDFDNHTAIVIKKGEGQLPPASLNQGEA
ncbi:MAG: hypothetical protein EOT04_02925 [Candidatus Chaera renei]|uniref:Uncharacterized protein n=1 Tax=Candidatus Chaera renei TaxID=2506947 RepID=A0A4Q0AHQ7_9BACT|nr:MAG: hypothetical protein EOT04_02925 [Candidatus Chaera renei]